VVAGAPAVWLIGGFYVAHLTGGSRPAAVAAAAAMMVVVVASNARGLHATARLQLGIAALLAALLLAAVTSALPSAHAAN
jgi:amino acid efflux transporter